MKKQVIFSGIQPSGDLNIGHFLGALKNWVDLQYEYDCIFSLVDLHTITVKQDPQQLRMRCYDTLAMYLACGIDPKQNIIFCQSHVPQHTELGWILNCFTYMGELNRMTQFKDKAKQHAANINVGLFSYPVLMAADILLYKTNLVPVGEDQKQHLEITRDVAMRFNNIYGEIFSIPEIYLPKIGARIMALQEPDKKMSKTDPNPNNMVNLLDAPDVIRDKLKRAVTDSGKEIHMHSDKPGVSNLLTILAAVAGKTIEQLEQEYAGQGYAKFKIDVAEALVAFLAPMQKHYHDIRGDSIALDKILHEGAEKASALAQPTLDKVRDAVGFIRK
jgi:tryptophanyl-tRNA synthetase